METRQLSLLKSISAMNLFRENPIRCMGGLHADGVDHAVLNLGLRKVHFLFHPELAEAVLRGDSESYCKARLVFDKITPLTGMRGLVQLEGEEGRRHRKITAPALSSIVLERALPAFRQHTAQEFAALRDASSSGCSLDLEPLISRVVLRNALYLVLGHCPEDLADTLVSRFLEINRQCGVGIKRLLPLPRFRPSRAVRELDAILYELIAQRSSAGDGTDLLSLMKRCPFADDRSQIRDHLATYLFAGYETTATSILTTIYCVAKNSGTAASLENAYREALRLFPPSWTLARQAVRGTALGNMAVKRGDLLFVGLPQIHRRPDFWKHPNEFAPERFESGPAHPFAYIPFGGGSRVCVGMRTAHLEAVTVLESLLAQFRFEAAPGYEPEIEAHITAHLKNGLMVRVGRKGESHESVLGIS
jgi:cytochrome P450